MTNVIRLRRRAAGGSAGAPSALKTTEPAYNEQDDILYLGKGDDGSGNATSILPVGGKGAFVDLSSTQTVAGAKTFSSSPIIPTPTAGDNSTKGATTAFVATAIAGAGAGDPSAATHAATSKTTPVDADEIPLADSAASFALKKLTWASLKATAKTYFDTLYEVAGAVATHAGLTVTHGATGAVVGTTNTQTLTNKTLTAPVVSTITNTGTLTLPTSTDTLVGRATTDTLTNKTLSGCSASNPATGDVSSLIATTSFVASAVSAAQSSLDPKQSVKVASTGNLTLSGEQTIDGVLTSVSRVLAKDQTTGSQNGLYLTGPGAWTRTTDADTGGVGGKVSAGLFVFVEQGTVNADSGWVLTSDDPITLGTTALTFAQFSGAGQITAGNGLSKSGNTLSVLGTTNRVSVSGAGVDISTSYVGQTSITTLGTIATGTWQGSVVGGAYGGLGVALSTLTDGGLIKRSGTTAATAVVDTDYLGPNSTIIGGTF